MSFKERIINFSGKFRSTDIEKSYSLDYCIPVYHCVSNDYLPHLKHIINYKNEKELEKDLDMLSKNFQFVDWEEFKKYVNGDLKPKKKIALLTFDDGLSQFYELVAPILERKGIYAINFINPKFINNQDLMFRCKASLLVDHLMKITESERNLILKNKFKNISSINFVKKLQRINFQEKDQIDQIADNLEVNFRGFLEENKPYLSSENLKTLIKKGFGISNHGFDHPLYHQLTLDEQVKNTNRSDDFFKENGIVNESFAFPFTDFGVKKEFFTQIFRNKDLFCSFGSAGLKSDSFEKNFQRIPMENGKSADQILKDEIAYFNLKKILNKNKIHRK